MHIHLPFLDSYLDPFLAMPILLFLLDEEMVLLRKRPRLTLPEIMACSLMFSFIFEWVFPIFSRDFTADIWDVTAYFAGAALYFMARTYDEKSSVT